MPEDEVEAAWRATAVYQIIRHAMNSQEMGSTESPFHALRPTETLLPVHATVFSAVEHRLSGWPGADVDRFVNELLAESEMLKKWIGQLASDESKLISSLQSLAKKDLDVSRGIDRVPKSQQLIRLGHLEVNIRGDDMATDTEMMF
jgi:hypothetical protein